MALEAIEPFRIVTLAAPGGGFLGLARLPGRSGALGADVAAIHAWGASCAVSLTEPAEMNALGSAGLQLALEECGITVHPFPIRDFSVPDVEASSWPELADRLHALLDEGSKVFIHCRGGFGRSGMIAARLLVERGLDPAAALAHVRRARPGAVENAAQEAWVSRKIVASQKG